MRRRVVTAVLATALAVAGCSAVPTTGPVERHPRSAQSPVAAGVQIAPEAPRPGATPEEVLAGFLSAMATYQAGYPAAKLFLTPDAAERWNPDEGISVYEAEGHRPITTDESAVMNVPIVGRVTAEGHFTSVQDTMFRHNFRMVSQEGEWRIGDAPSGLLISRRSFARYFRPINMYFLSPHGTTVAPEVVYLASGNANPTMALQALLRGPSPWLRPAVLNAIPAGTAMTVPAVVIDSEGVATVPLTAQVAVLADSQRAQLATQVVWTLSQFPEVNGVRFTSEGQPFAVPNGDGAGVVRPRDVREHQVVAEPLVTDAFVVSQGVLGQLDEQANGQFVPWSGAFGTSDWGDTVGEFGVTRDASMAVVVNAAGTRLHTNTAGSPAAVFRYAGPGLGRPQIMHDASIWVSSRDKAGRPVLVRVASDGDVATFRLKGLEKAAIDAFSVSPDGTRIALVARTGTSSTLGLLRILRGTTAVDGWRPLAIVGPQGAVVDFGDVGWSDPVKLTMLGSVAGDAGFSVYSADMDGGSVENIGPFDVDAVGLATQPRPSGRTALLLADGGSVWRYEDVFRWRQLSADITAIGYAH